jgi:hypothetical protein
MHHDTIRDPGAETSAATRSPNVNVIYAKSVTQYLSKVELAKKQAPYFGSPFARAQNGNLRSLPHRELPAMPPISG